MSHYKIYQMKSKYHNNVKLINTKKYINILKKNI